LADVNEGVKFEEGTKDLKEQRKREKISQKHNIKAKGYNKKSKRVRDWHVNISRLLERELSRKGGEKYVYRTDI
jgi:hypothetical protein